MPGMLMAARAGNRMQARQTYRTINRMERRRGVPDRGAYGPPAYYQPPPPPVTAAPSHLAYIAELERLAQLHAQGVISDVEFSAKKRQVLRI